MIEAMLIIIDMERAALLYVMNGKMILRHLEPGQSKMDTRKILPLIGLTTIRDILPVIADGLEQPSKQEIEGAIML